MKILILNFVLLFIPVLIAAQDTFDDGIIITKDLDTINCLVPLQINYGKTIKIISSQDSKKRKINSSEIKYLITKYNVYENVTYKEKNEEIEKLMRVVIVGYVTLYLNTYLNQGGPSYSGDGGTYNMYSSPTLDYVIKKNDETFFIVPKRFKEIIIPIIGDAPGLVKMIENNSLKYDNIEEVVKEYNKTHSN